MLLLSLPDESIGEFCTCKELECVRMQICSTTRIS